MLEHRKLRENILASYVVLFFDSIEYALCSMVLCNVNMSWF